MARRIGKLSARQVAAAKTGRHGDGAGLYLIVAESGARKWVFRFTRQRRVTEAGLGSYPATGLAGARAKAMEARKLVAAGINPIEAKREARRAADGRKTFGQCADALIAAKSPEWRNAKHRAQWRMTLTEYAKPLRGLPVDEVDTAAVLGVLRPLWQAKPETASRLRGRIEAVLDFAKAQGMRQGENPAAWRGHLALILPTRQRLTRGHHAAMAYADVPAFIEKLRERESMAVLSLEFLILTAARSGEALGARWDEVDLESKVWTVPATRMKAGREHRVPLSAPAMAILERLAAVRTCEFIFSGQTARKPLSPMAIAMVLRRSSVEAATPHGFRSSFRDWCGEETSFPREIAEAALAHVSGDSTERAYRRGDALQKRRALMEAWGAYCQPKQAGKVVSLSARGRKWPRESRKL